MDDLHLHPPKPPSTAAYFAFMPLCGCTRVSAGCFAELPDAEQGFLAVGVSSGALTLSYEEHAFIVGAGHACVLPAAASCPLFAEQDTRLLYAVLTGQAADALLTETLETSVFFPQGCTMLAEALLPLLQAEEASIAGTAVSALSYGLLTQLYKKSAAPDGEACYPTLVCDALAILREDFAFLYGVDDLANRLQVSAPHLIRLFSRAVGVSPGRYLTHLRIEYAKLVLRSGETSIEAVAASSGFSGASYFGKVFRRETGVTPRQYAAAHPAARHSKVDTLYV